MMSEEFQAYSLAAPEHGGSAVEYTERFQASGEEFSPPLSVAITATTPSVKIAVAGGAYQVGATGEWVTIPDKEPAAGTHAYFVVVQDAARGVTSATVVINSATLDPVQVVPAGAGTPEVATSNILLAEVVTSGTPPTAKVVQRRHGNFTLGLWQIDGDVVRWPETVIGSIPPDA